MSRSSQTRPQRSRPAQAVPRRTNVQLSRPEAAMVLVYTSGMDIVGLHAVTLTSGVSRPCVRGQQSDGQRQDAMNGTCGCCMLARRRCWMPTWNVLRGIDVVITDSCRARRLFDLFVVYFARRGAHQARQAYCAPRERSCIEPVNSTICGHGGRLRSKHLG